ncbi:MAG: hypothetical protein RIQ68_730 [Pseudomonadota bacterium]|jgi:hypothetical protein
MRIALALACFLFPAATFAQTHAPIDHSGAMHHGTNSAVATQIQIVAREPGQSAFAAIQEIVAILRADPKTDWSKVNVEALRQHLIDMNNVTLGAAVKTEMASQSITFIVSGTGTVRGSIQRMVLAHAQTMNGVNGWKLTADKTSDGAKLTITAASQDLAKLNALGFIGVMTEGMHHQEHHLALARGSDPHHKH